MFDTNWFPILITRCHARLRTMYIVIGLLTSLCLLLLIVLIVLAASSSSDNEKVDGSDRGPEGDVAEDTPSGSQYPYVPTNART